jgi:hypothetical protein
MGFQSRGRRGVGFGHDEDTILKNRSFHNNCKVLYQRHSLFHTKGFKKVLRDEISYKEKLLCLFETWMLKTQLQTG